MMVESQPSKIPVINQLTFLGQAFSRFVDLSLGYLVQVQVFLNHAIKKIGI